ncbi:MAG TPA: DUF1156 domain-containing protein, partial [Candidatus Tectomicrobia bacterium]
MTPTRKKLIEVSLPLEDINRAAAREKSIRHGHPSTLHLWWARRPLAAARAVIFAQMVDDPSSLPEEFPNEEAQEAERQRLFQMIRELVKWENTTNERLLEAARAEIRKSWARWCRLSGEDPTKLPPFHDPFAGGGSLPLEAQRLGLEAHASDLNPVAVLINKAMIEIPPRFAGQPPVNPEARGKLGLQGGWRGAAGLADDVRYYGAWMRQQAIKRIGHLYPQATLPDGRQATVIAWLWARTVESPNPAFRGCQVPLVSSFWLSTKPGKEAWVEPVVEGKSYHFEVRTGKPTDKAKVDAGTKLGRGANFRCVLSSSPITPDYIKAEGMAGRMGTRLMAIVAEGSRGRTYLPPTEEMDAIAQQADPTWRPEQPMPENPRWFSPPDYGMPTYADLFTRRQLVALTTFSELVVEARTQIHADALTAGLPDAPMPLRDGGSGAMAYAEAVGVYLGIGVSKLTDYNSSLVLWSPSRDQTKATFARQALPMVWDFAEVNPLAEAAGDLTVSLSGIAQAMIGLPSAPTGYANQVDAAEQQTISTTKIISTDPPYYDNIGYADLSDFFYVWLRKSLQLTYPALFSTLLVPKAGELVATPYRHGSREAAETYFLDGMTRAMHGMAKAVHPVFPVTIYYAFKQSEQDHNGTASTGWETFLEAVIRAGFSLTGTWPARTERASRSTGIDTNALASSIILVCRPRPADASVASRRDFLTALKREMPSALRHLQQGNIAPEDLAQASIGPGMAIFTRYARILESDGTPMRVRTALALINQTLDEMLAEQAGDFDADTGWAVAWFDQFGFNDGPFGDAETLCKAKNTAISGLQEAGIAIARAGKVRLLRVDELPATWDPLVDQRLTVWESVHHLIRALNEGET